MAGGDESSGLQGGDWPPPAGNNCVLQPCFPNWRDNRLDQHLDQPGVEEEAVHLLQQLLVYDPSRRLTARAALDHPYFTTLDRESLPAKPGQFDVGCV